MTVKGGSKTQNGRFPCKIALRLTKVCYKVSSCENCQRQSCKAFTGLTIGAKWLVRNVPCTWNFVSNWPRLSEIADFRYIFALIASAVTPSEKSSISTNRNSTTRFPMIARSGTKVKTWYADESAMLKCADLGLKCSKNSLWSGSKGPIIGVFL